MGRPLATRVACVAGDMMAQAAGTARQAGERERDRFLAGLQSHRAKGAGYLETIQHLPADVVQDGTRWLDQIVDGVTGLLASQVPALDAAHD